MAAGGEQKQWQAVLAITLTILYYICWPIGVFIYYLALLAFAILKILYQPVGFILLPILYLGRFLLACLYATFQILAKFEVTRLPTINM
jgi:hypothetical protein